jgi:hypothetical protein
MTDTTAEAAGETTAEGTVERKRAPASNFLPIVRGRLPLVFVHAVRFDSVLNAMANKDLASKLATSVGKIFDIKKGRNFGYVNAEYKPTQDDLAAADAWIAQVGAENAKGQKANGDTELMQRVVDEYKARGLATAEEAAALSAARGASRKKAEPKEAGAASTGDEKAVQGAGAADALLS